MDRPHRQAASCGSRARTRPTGRRQRWTHSWSLVQRRRAGGSNSSCRPQPPPRRVGGCASRAKPLFYSRDCAFPPNVPSHTRRKDERAQRHIPTLHHNNGREIPPTAVYLRLSWLTPRPSAPRGRAAAAAGTRMLQRRRRSRHLRRLRTIPTARTTRSRGRPPRRAGKSWDLAARARLRALLSAPARRGRGACLRRPR